jgi:hypothetical protein
MLDYAKRILTAQFEAALCMLDHRIRECPAEHWEEKVANGVAVDQLFLVVKLRGAVSDRRLERCPPYFKVVHIGCSFMLAIRVSRRMFMWNVIAAKQSFG